MDVKGFKTRFRLPIDLTPKEGQAEMELSPVSVCDEWGSLKMNNDGKRKGRGCLDRQSH